LRSAVRLSAVRAGNPAGVANDIARLEQIRARSRRKTPTWSTEVEVQRATVVAWVDYANGDRDRAPGQLRTAADLEDRSEKNVVSPGRILPAHELLGDILLGSKYPGDALTEYKASLKHDPKRYRSLAGAARAAMASHNVSEAHVWTAAWVQWVCFVKLAMADRYWTLGHGSY
jgi:hypothetical protein